MGSPRVSDPAQKKLVARELRKSGAFLSNIAEKLDVSYTWVWKHTKDLPKPPSPPSPNRLAKGQSGFNRLIADYKRSATDRDILWGLEDQEFRTLTEGRCFYCGALPASTKRTSKHLAWEEYTYNGVDRADNSLGYVDSNVVSCCKRCNKLKGKLSAELFIQTCKKIATHKREANHDHR